MTRLRIWATATLTLAILAFIALFLMFLALVDISHGEKNVVLEWLVVKLGLFVILSLIVATIVCAGLVLKYFRGKEAEKKRQIPD